MSQKAERSTLAYEQLLEVSSCLSVSHSTPCHILVLVLRSFLGHMNMLCDDTYNTLPVSRRQATTDASKYSRFHPALFGGNVP